jgi:hypothetical protein
VGISVVWGNSIQLNPNGSEVNGPAVLWGNSVCWGQSGTEAFSVVRGSGAVSGLSGVWSSSSGGVEALNIMADGDN